MRTPLVLRFQRATWRSLEASHSILRGLLSGVWLGVLSRQHFINLNSRYYAHPNSHHTETHNRGGLFPWESAIVDGYFGRARSIVLLGAGAGRECAALEDLGLEVDGFECHDGLRETGISLFGADFGKRCLQPMEPDTCPPLPGRYGGAILGWGMYTLIQGRRRRVQVLTDLRAACKPGSPLLMSFFLRGGSRRPYRIAAAIANTFRRPLGREPVEYGDDLSPTFAHFFSREELESELREGGWNVAVFDRRSYPHAVAHAAP